TKRRTPYRANRHGLRDRPSLAPDLPGFLCLPVPESDQLPEIREKLLCRCVVRWTANRGTLQRRAEKPDESQHHSARQHHSGAVEPQLGKNPKRFANLPSDILPIPKFRPQIGKTLGLMSRDRPGNPASWNRQNSVVFLPLSLYLLKSILVVPGL